jgi:hypothetical protein
VVAQKPPEGTLLNNFFKYGTGLFDFSAKTEKGLTPSNVLQVEEIEGVPPIFFCNKEDLGIGNHLCILAKHL